jgi:hypothetical protein
MKQKPIEIDTMVTMDGKKLRFKKPFLLVPKFDATKKVYYVSHRGLGIGLAAQSREELIGEVSNEIAFLWCEYAIKADKKLTLDAQELKRTLLEMIEEIDDPTRVEPPMFKKTVMVYECLSPKNGPKLCYFEASFSLEAIDAIIVASDFILQHCKSGDYVSLELYGETRLDAFVEKSDGEIEDYATCEEWLNGAEATFAVGKFRVLPRIYVESCGRYSGESILISELKAFKAAHTSQGDQNG